MRSHFSLLFKLVPFGNFLPWVYGFRQCRSLEQPTRPHRGKMRSIACPASVSRRHFYISPYHHQQSVVLNINERSCFSLRTFMRQTRTCFIVAATFALRVLYKNIQDCSWKLAVVTLLRACCTLFPYIPLYALLMIIMIPLGEGGGGWFYSAVCVCVPLCMA
jgi:hypothetical protein